MAFSLNCLPSRTCVFYLTTSLLGSFVIFCFYWAVSDFYRACCVSCRFFPIFSDYVYKLCDTRVAVVYATRSVLRAFQDDGVVYLELRTTPRVCADLTREGYVAAVVQTVEDWCRENGEKMVVKVILSVDRRHTAEEAGEVVDLAVKYKGQGVVGVDLCGDPTRGEVEVYRDAFARARADGLGITLHFAEVEARDGSELETLLSFCPQRVGHVIHVPEHVREEIRRRKLGLELCLTCNVHAKMISGGFADHHFGYWRDKGCPIAISVSDGPFVSAACYLHERTANRLSDGRCWDL
jgi:adenosine deaminase